MDDLLIDGCTFNRNKAFDGYSIYIEGVENARTNFVIKNNIFTDNYDEWNLSPNKSVIASEIFNLYDGIVVESNTFTYTSTGMSVVPLFYVDHYGNPILQTPTQSATQSATESATQSDTQSAIQSATESATQPPTEPPTETPTQPPIIPSSQPSIQPPTEDPDIRYIYIDESESNGRFNFSNTDSFPTIVIVLISQFINISSTKNGGGIYIKNTALLCIEDLIYILTLCQMKVQMQ